MLVTRCRMCKSARLVQFLDMGMTPPADQFRTEERLTEPDTYYPLQVVLCEECGLTQLSYVVSPEILYRDDYPYESSTTRTGGEHWAEFARTTVEMLGLGNDDLVVDVGSNVGVLLEMFRNNGTRVMGVDPATNIARIAERRGIPTLGEFFNLETARRIVEEYGPASVVTATNVFAHVDDLDDFVLALDVLLNERGVFILEAPYFVNLLSDLEYDTIYHEHLSYLSMRPVVSYLRRFDMRVFDVQQRDIHGGSFRVFVRRAEACTPAAAAVSEMLDMEEREGVHDVRRLREFACAVEQNRHELLWLLRRLRHEGKSIVAVSAPAKGMSLLNYCHIGKETLDFVTEKSTLKIGRYTPGARIPVMPDSALVERRPDYALLLAWNFADEIMSNLSEYREGGGKFIIPISTPHIVE